jgi:hypothetical protein
MCLEETEARNGCTGEGQQKFNRPTYQVTTSDDFNTETACTAVTERRVREVAQLHLVRVSEKNKRRCELYVHVNGGFRSKRIPENTG